MNETELTTIADVEAYAAQHGIVLTAKERAQIGTVQRAARDEWEALHPEAPTPPPSFADRFNVFYPKFLRFIVGLGETMLTLSQTVLTALGVPVVLVLLLIVEHQRVVHGIELFETDSSLAGFAALALVLLNLVLEFLTHYIEHQHGYTPDRENRWSFRIWRQNAGYTIGFGEKWTARPLSPAARYKRLLSLVTFSILALALVGSMKSVIEDYTVAWHLAIAEIIEQSDLLTIMTWAGGLLFAAAAVLSAQGLSRYVALRCVEILAAMHDAESVQSAVEQAAPGYQVDVDRAGALAALALVNSKIEAKAQKAAAKADKPISVSQNGHSHEGADFLAMPTMYQHGDGD